MIHSTMRHTQPNCKVYFTKLKKKNDFSFYISPIRFFSLSLHKISQMYKTKIMPKYDKTN